MPAATQLLSIIQPERSCTPRWHFVRLCEASEQHAAKLSRVAKAVWAGREKVLPGVVHS